MQTSTRPSLTACAALFLSCSFWILWPFILPQGPAGVRLDLEFHIILFLALFSLNISAFLLASHELRRIAEGSSPPSGAPIALWARRIAAVHVAIFLVFVVAAVISGYIAMQNEVGVNFSSRLADPF